MEVSVWISQIQSFKGRIFFGLGVIDKIEIAPKLGQNGILQAFLKVIFENT